MGEASVLDAKRRWFRSGSQRMIAGALPVAVGLSLGSYAVGILLPSFALAYVVGALLLTNLALFASSLSLLGLRDRYGRWFSLTLVATGLIGIVSCLWLMAETLVLGISIALPTGFLIIDSLGNVAIIIGLAAVSVGQHRRGTTRPVGYLFLSLFFFVCVFLTYQANLVGNPPMFLALALGGRILLSYFSAVFAWSFFSSQRLPVELVGRSTRGVLVAALVLQLLARTVFELQYAGMHTVVSSFFLVGSSSDVLVLLAQCVLLIANLAFFTQIAELKPAARPGILRLSTASRTFLLGMLVAAVLVTATTAIALVGRVLPVFLQQADAMLALHAISGGLIIGVAIVLLTFGVVAAIMNRFMMRPMQQLSDGIAEATQAGLSSYQEPQNLAFAELQAVSDGYSQLLDALKRTRSQLRAPDPFAHRKSGTPAEGHGPAFQSALLEYQAAIASEAILRSTKALAHSVDGMSDAKKGVRDIIAVTEQLREVLRVLQVLRQVEAGELPEPASRDLGNILRQVIEATKDRFGERVIRASLELPEPHCRILANDLASDIFTSILSSIVRNDANEEVVIGLAVSQVQELNTTYWKTVITTYGWIVPDEQKDIIFQRDASQAHTAPPGLLLAKILSEVLHGALRTGNEVPYDQHYGTAFAVLLPAVMQDQALRLRMKKPEPRRP